MNPTDSTLSENEEFYKDIASYASWTLIEATFLVLGYLRKPPKEYHRWIEKKGEILPVYNAHNQNDMEQIEGFFPFIEDFKESDQEKLWVGSRYFYQISTKARYPDVDQLVMKAINYVESGELSVMKMSDVHTAYSRLRPNVFLEWCINHNFASPPQGLINLFPEIIRTQKVRNHIENDKKNDAPFKDWKWEDLKFILQKRCFQIRKGDVIQNFDESNPFYDGRVKENTKDSKLWSIFNILAMSHGTISSTEKRKLEGVDGTLEKKDISRIRKILKEITGINDDPFNRYSKNNKCWTFKALIELDGYTDEDYHNQTENLTRVTENNSTFSFDDTDEENEECLDVKPPGGLW